MATATPPLRVILYEGAGARPLAPERRTGVARELLRRGYGVTMVRGERGVSAPGAGSMLVLGEFDGAVPELEDDAGLAGIETESIAGAAPEEIAARVDSRRTAGAAGPPPGQWKPWFPVIDHERCTNCMQCLSFCLFDVYGVDAERRIQVRNPDKCKTNCPACSRVCPEVAILFPKYRGGPINGDVVNESDVDREKMKIDVSALLGGDIYSLLRQRHERAQSRFSKERDENKALEERRRCLAKLQEKLDIPPEVLMALPSMNDIQFKANQLLEEAQRRSREARGLAEPAG